MKHSSLRMPAEWEAVEAVLVAWPHADTDWNYMLDEVRDCYRNLIKAIADIVDVIVIGPEEPDYSPDTNIDRVKYINIPTNDTWIRDYGPIASIDESGLVLNDFCFNAWGLKFAADRDNLANKELSHKGIFAAPLINRLGFVLEGGSVESDGKGTLLTTASCLLSPNRNGDLNRKEVEEHMNKYLGFERVLWLEHGSLAGDDTDGHIDTLARLVPPGDTILFVGCHNTEHPDYAELAAMKDELTKLRCADGMPYNLIELPLPDPIYDPEDNSLLPATYANFLIVNDTVLMPTYGQALADMTAKMSIQAAMPNHKIVCVDCRALIRQHGSLHCATMQLHSGSINH